MTQKHLFFCCLLILSIAFVIAMVLLVLGLIWFWSMIVSTIVTLLLSWFACVPDNGEFLSDFIDYSKAREFRFSLFLFLLLNYLGLFVFALNLMISIGDQEAKTIRKFYVYKTAPECVALYITSDRVICAPFDREKKEVENSYQVLYFQDHQVVSFSYEEVGPLHLKPTPTPTATVTPVPIATNTPLPTDVPTVSSTSSDL